MRIRTFGPDGSRRRALLLEHLLVLESRDLVVLRRGRRGKVLSAHFCGELGHPLKCHLATKYTKRETVAGAYKIVQHKPLPYRAAEATMHHVGTAEQIDLAVRLMFLPVLLSCLRTKTAEC
jgi:hypothetical protein